MIVGVGYDDTVAAAPRYTYVCAVAQIDCHHALRLSS